MLSESNLAAARRVVLRKPPEECAKAIGKAADERARESTSQQRGGNEVNAE